MSTRKPARRNTHVPSVIPTAAPKSTKIRVRWDRIAGAIALGVVFIAMIWWALTLMSSPVQDNSAPRCTDAIADAGGVCQGEPLPACPTEDSTNCYWDARTMGNGEGTSFVDVDGSRTFGNQ